MVVPPDTPRPATGPGVERPGDGELPLALAVPVWIALVATGLWLVHPYPRVLPALVVPTWLGAWGLVFLLSRRRRAERARHFLVATGTLAVVLGTLEVAARASYESPWYDALVDEHGRRRKLEFERNAHGLRDRDHAPEKPEGTRRVLVLGDSFTEGYGVADDDAIFPARLEAMLNEGDLPPEARAVEVLNAGVSGSLTGEWVELFRTLVDPFRPDLVLIVFFLRDGTETSSMGAYFKPIRNRIVRENEASPLYRHSFLFRTFQDRIDRRRIADDYERDVILSYTGTREQQSEWRRARENLLELRRLAADASAVTGLVVFPVLVGLEDDEYPFQAVCDEILRFAHDAALPALDLLPAYRGLRSADLWVSSLDQHPNERGHEIAAEAMAPFVRALL